MNFKVGDRVIFRGDIGHIESVEYLNDESLPCVDVRWVTPNNEPSVLTSTVFNIDELKKIPDNVLPMPKSKEWWAESKAFCEAIETILLNEFEK